MIKMKINDFNCGELKIGLFVMLISIFSLISCKKYLDLKPNSSLYIASSLRDCQALLDDYSTMNGNYPSDGEAAADDYYLTEESWLSLPDIESQNTYIWDSQGEHKVSQWHAPYKTIFNSNLVLQLLNNIDPTSSSDYYPIKGAALFFRGYALFSCASLFCKPYAPSSSALDPGIPLRLSPEVDQKDDRGTVQQTYDRIIQDLKDAYEILPETSSIQSRPTKTAALGAIARVYLAMGDYTSAGVYADACLKKHNTLLNFNSLAIDSPFPFERFNSEVIFHSVMTGGASLDQTVAKVVGNLYDSYEINDLRKNTFFIENTDLDANTYSFKGSYDGSIGLFNGIATDEMYMIRAECFARSGKIPEALKDLNDLLVTRWKEQTVNGVTTTTYRNYTTTNADEALDFILTERRKELYFRGTRWTDLRRLNKEGRYARTLTRLINGSSYSLPPNDPRYTFLIPRDVINNSSIPQNAR